MKHSEWLIVSYSEAEFLKHLFPFYSESDHKIERKEGLLVKTYGDKDEEAIVLGKSIIHP